MRTLRLEPVLVDVQGLRTLYVVPVIPDDAPEHIREGLARRRLAAISGTCPCGAQRPKLSRQQLRQARRGGEPSGLVIHHDDQCPATDDVIAAWLKSAA